MKIFISLKSTSFYAFKRSAQGAHAHPNNFALTNDTSCNNLFLDKVPKNSLNQQELNSLKDNLGFNAHFFILNLSFDRDQPLCMLRSKESSTDGIAVQRMICAILIGRQVGGTFQSHNSTNQNNTQIYEEVCHHKESFQVESNSFVINETT